MNYTIVNGELCHYGVPGMKWGHRKAQRVEARQAARSKKYATQLAKQTAVREAVYNKATWYTNGKGDYYMGGISKATAKKLNKGAKATTKLVTKLNKKYGSDWKYNSGTTKGRSWVEAVVGGQSSGKVYID